MSEEHATRLSAANVVMAVIGAGIGQHIVSIACAIIAFLIHEWSARRTAHVVEGCRQCANLERHHARRISGLLSEVHRLKADNAGLRARLEGSRLPDTAPDRPGAGC